MAKKVVLCPKCNSGEKLQSNGQWMLFRKYRCDACELKFNTALSSTERAMGMFTVGLMAYQIITLHSYIFQGIVILILSPILIYDYLVRKKNLSYKTTM